MILNLHNQDFDAELLNKVIDAFNTEEKITIYLRSTGGDVAILLALLDIVNNNHERFELIGLEYLGSCAFEFYVKAKCDKKLIKPTLGVYHQFKSPITTNENGKPYYDADKIYLSESKEYYAKDSADFLDKCEFLAKERRQFKQNKDVYFLHDRFLEIVDNYNKNTK